MKRNLLMRLLLFTLLFFKCSLIGYAQNSRVGDGFGGRLWYRPYSYTVSAYAAFAICDIEKQLYAWGSNDWGELGDGGEVFEIGSDIPVKVEGMNNIKFFTGGYMGAAILEDNTGWVWGKFGEPSKRIKPRKVLENIKFVSAGSRHCSYVKNDGTVWSLGNNDYGAFGDGSTTPLNSGYFTTPVQMIGITNAVRVSASNMYSIVLLNDGTVMSVGSNFWGGLGIGDTTVKERTTPIRVPGLSNIVDIKSNFYASIALDNEGNVWTWGRTSSLNYDYRSSPIKITRLKNIVAISSRDDGAHFLALDSNHICYAWGNNSIGQCGLDLSVSEILDPEIVATGVDDILAGELFSYIIKTDGSLYATGKSIDLSASIWLNLPNILRDTFTQINSFCKPIKTQNTLSMLTSIDTIMCLGDTLKVAVPFSANISIEPASGYSINYSAGFIQFYGPSDNLYKVTITNGSFKETVDFSIKFFKNAKAVFKFSPPNASIDNPMFNCINQSNNAIKYQWYYKGKLISSDKDIVKTFQDTGLYCLTLVAINQCEHRDSVSQCCKVYQKGKIAITNAFTPNGDSKNDKFKAIVNGSYQSFSLLIMNRYGQEIFKTEDPKLGWDGTFNGQDMDVGVYYYLIKVKFDYPDAVEEMYKGDISLLR